MARKKLSDVFYNSERENLEQAWGATKAAPELSPIPGGIYKCHIISGELSSSRNGTPSFKVCLEVVEGDHEGRRVWHDIWLSSAAMPMAKRDLAKLGVTALEQLERPLPRGIVVEAKVALRREDDDREFNKIVRFKVLGIVTPDPDPYAPAEEPGDTTADADGFDWQTGEQQEEGPTA